MRESASPIMSAIYQEYKGSQINGSIMVIKKEQDLFPLIDVLLYPVIYSYIQLHTLFCRTIKTSGDRLNDSSEHVVELVTSLHYYYFYINYTYGPSTLYTTVSYTKVLHRIKDLLRIQTTIFIK